MRLIRTAPSAELRPSDKKPVAASAYQGAPPQIERAAQPALPAELPIRARQLLRSLAERTSSLAGLGRKAGHSLQWVWRLANTAKNFPLEKILVVLREAEVPTRFYFEELVADEPALTPAWLLRHFREGLPQAEASSPAVLAASRLLARWQAGELELAPGARQAEDWLADAGERRHARAEEVRAELEQRLEPWGETMATTRGELLDFTQMLALLAIIERRRGHRDVAVDLLAIAFELAEALRDDFLLAHLFGRAAFLLSDLGQSRWALWAVDQATRLFTYAGDIEQANLTLSERGLILVKLGRTDEAAVFYRRALERVPADRWRVHASAHSGLAAAAEQAGDLELAARHLRDAVQIYKGNDFGLASLCWRAGSLARARGDFDEAVRSLRRTLELLGLFGQPIDVALAAVDLADVFARQGKGYALRHLGEEVLPWLMKFRHNSWAEAAVGELARLLCHGEVSLPQLAALRRQLLRRP